MGSRIIIHSYLRAPAELNQVQEQLGAFKKAKLLAILAKDDMTWSRVEALVVLSCIRDALEASDE